ncbi:MAG: malonate decarboxylase holo-[acyl-carrier-protein] synthase [Pseudomonadota bacterium]
MNRVRRHALVWLSRPPVAQVEADSHAVARWHGLGRPFVATRQRDGQEGLALAFCTADEKRPQLRPRRMAVLANPDDAAKVDLPPLLHVVADCPAAQRYVRSFTFLAENAGALAIRVYGSWMWQALTGEPHVHAASDLDVFLEVADGAAADRAAALLAEIEPALDFRLDGELSFPDFGEVNWREYRSGAAELLVKSVSWMRLVPRAELPS